jgi:hypothetical protein
MNIVSVKQLPGQQDYLLKEDDKTVLKLCYKKDLHTARVETEKERRVLIIDDEGLLKTKSVLKNEYGVRIGSLNYDKFSDTQGSVDIENMKYRFIVKRGEIPELNIYKGTRRNLVYNCQLAFQDISSRIKGSQTASLIIAVSWYLFLNEAVSLVPAFNEAIIL